MKPTAQEIADWIFETSATETSNQNWITYHNNICKKFGVTPEWCEQKHQEILDCLNADDRILDINDDDDCFDIIVNGNEVCARCSRGEGSHCEHCEVSNPYNQD